MSSMFCFRRVDDGMHILVFYSWLRTQLAAPQLKDVKQETEK